MGLLNTLQLDHNSIVKLEPGAFSDVRNLETVTLNKNGIPGMDGNQFFFYSKHENSSLTRIFWSKLHSCSSNDSEKVT